jgi:hypothetical protein
MRRRQEIGGPRYDQQVPMVNDPHVAALHYDLLIGPGVDFANAPPLCHSEPAFDVRLEPHKAKFTMKRHFATEQDALNVVQPFVDAWNVWTGLELLPNRFRLAYSHSEIIDRAPTPGIHALHARNLTTHSPELGRPLLTVHWNRFPSPPPKYQVSPEVNAMYLQFCAYSDSIVPLVHMAYFCLTVLEQGISPNPTVGTRKRQMAAKKFAIHADVLQKIGHLSTE